jgi:16S rRNA G527 N7-methylase RsmG
MGCPARAAQRAERVVDAWQEHAGQIRLPREVMVPHMTRHPRGKEVIQHAAHAVDIGSGAGGRS